MTARGGGGEPAEKLKEDAGDAFPTVIGTADVAEG